MTIIRVSQRWAYRRKIVLRYSFDTSIQKYRVSIYVSDTRYKSTEYFSMLPILDSKIKIGRYSIKIVKKSFSLRSYLKEIYLKSDYDGGASN